MRSAVMVMLWFAVVRPSRSDWLHILAMSGQLCMPEILVTLLEL